MKNKYYITVLFLSVFFSVNAQFQWHAIQSIANDVNNGQRYDDVFFLNENLGWAANGFFAAIYKTTDGGNSWELKVDGDDLGGGLYFRNIEFLDENIGFIGTLNNKTFKTNDGGETWTQITNFSINPIAICGLDAVGSSTVYGFGAYFEPAFMIKSTDSGATWQYTDMTAHATALVETKFVNENLGYAAGKSATGAIIIKTTDGGATWTEIDNSGIAGEYVWKLQILDGTSNNVIFGAVEAESPNVGKLIKTIDAGANWTTKAAPESHIQAVGFISETHGWMGGNGAGIHETTDGGDTWTDVGVGGNLNRIFVVNSSTVYAAGTTVYKYTDQTLSTDQYTTERVPLEIKMLDNPIGDNLKLSVSYLGADNILIELYDITGKLIKLLVRDRIQQINYTKEYDFDVSELSPGLYILGFHNSTGRQSVKFVKK
ncbi:MAG: T9SS type A sorting domain-containing protein [Flavobacteriaceae bacterium]|nr:T9SS type A sorting domain-containing protein [Flavobacteriaceae bacterium]